MWHCVLENKEWMFEPLLSDSAWYRMWLISFWDGLQWRLCVVNLDVRHIQVVDYIMNVELSEVMHHVLMRGLCISPLLINLRCYLPCSFVIWTSTLVSWCAHEQLCCECMIELARWLDSDSAQGLWSYHPFKITESWVKLAVLPSNNQDYTWYVSPSC